MSWEAETSGTASSGTASSGATLNTIKIVTASAGSGKTTTLATILKDALSGDDAHVRPEGVLATTFTNKAAAELAERTGQHLIKAGLFSAAHRLGAARMGTVNAVCGEIVREFAFELGISPEVSVIDEREAVKLLDVALSAVVKSLEPELAALSERMPDFQWSNQVQRIIDRARTNDIDDAALRDCAKRSVETFKELLPEPLPGEHDARLEQALRDFVAGARKLEDSTDATKKAINRCAKVLPLLQEKKLSWSEWAALSNLSAGKRSGAHDLAEPVREAASAHDRHPGLRADCVRSIELVFELAARALAQYDSEKRRLRVIDFVDQEVRCLELLKRDDVRERLREAIDLVLVDEFQDTSPLQLAIFLELAKIAPRSVWVGDQKQSIFGFRGTDPALMDSALEEMLTSPDPDLINDAVQAIVQREKPEVLDTSFRSRPELVDVTSALFARRFAEHGIPEERVRLKPHLTDEPAGLGANFEHWQLTLEKSSKTTLLPHCVVRGVQELLSEGAMVRDRQSGHARKMEPQDIAILCRTNNDCHTATAALESVGIPANVARTGLLSTLECAVALAGLRLFVDGQSSLARAELTRLIDFAEQPSAWLEALLSERDDSAQSALTRAVDEARTKSPDAGPVQALDLVIDALELRRLCAAWGRSAQRLGNLDALRAHAVTYAEQHASQGASPAGLVVYLRGLAGTNWLDQPLPLDHQAFGATPNAVTVMTWHRAKGLEWPVVVLSGLERTRSDDARGVRVLSERASFDLHDPLGGRWIQYWPWPYRSNSKNVPLLDRLQKHPTNNKLVEQLDAERLRLLYVGWTRARDRLVLAAQKKKFHLGTLADLHGQDGQLPEPDKSGAALWGSKPVSVRVRELEVAEAEPAGWEAGCYFDACGPVDHPLAFISPSAVLSTTAVRSTTAVVAESIELGPSLAIASGSDMQKLGEALHGYFGAKPQFDAADAFLEASQGMLDKWGTATALHAGDVVSAAERFWQWVETRWPGAEVQREYPLVMAREDGAVVRGTADLVVQTDAGFAVIDHKSFPGGKAEQEKKAASFGGQLRQYALMLEAVLGKKSLGTFIHMPVAGRIFRVE